MSSLPLLRPAFAMGLIAVLLLGAPCARAELVFGRLVPAAPGTEPNNASRSVDVSADGKTVVFSSDANNWVPGDSYTNIRVVAVDMDTNTIQIVSRTTAGTTISGIMPVVSGDGRYVAFLNYSQNLGLGVPTSGWQAVRKDRVTGTLALVSATAAGQPAASGSVEDDSVAISANGRYVAFAALLTLIGLPDDGYTHIFVKDMDTGALELASVHANGNPVERGCQLWPRALSGNGRFLAMNCPDREAVPGADWGQSYLRDLELNTTTHISRTATVPRSSTSTTRLAISPNGRYTVFRVPSWGGLGHLNGSHTNNSGFYLYDRQGQSLVPLPRPALSEYDSCVSADVSDVASVLMACPVPAVGGGASHNQIFLHTPGAAGTPLLITGGAGGNPRGNNRSGDSLAIDASGLSLAFDSLASNLVASDNNNVSDIFVRVETNLLAQLFADGFED